MLSLFCRYEFLVCSNHLFFYPETAGRSLEEIDIIFAKAYVEKDNHGELLLLYQNYHYKVEDESKSLGLYDDDFEKDNFETKEDVSDGTASNSNGVLKNQKMFKSKGLFLL